MLGASLGLAGSPDALRGAALHVLAHGVGKALLFLSVGALVYSTGSRRIADYAGALRRTPVAAAAFLIGALTVTGVPPFAGFWSKLLMVKGALSLGPAGAWLGGLILVESVVAFGWFLWIGQRVFLGPPSPLVAAIASPTRAMNTALVLLAALCLLITVVGLPLARAIAR
jgi:formate hydrogenlyase subunit 3/multisubunit Na+/H+ antiporter MnhD subunit